jgi:hypothetical protein
MPVKDLSYPFFLFGWGVRIEGNNPASSRYSLLGSSLNGRFSCLQDIPFYFRTRIQGEPQSRFIL